MWSDDLRVKLGISEEYFILCIERLKDMGYVIEPIGSPT